ncbi:CP27A protein, partial [Atractosteus spatula]|nr:CP27A protein [Atractosteus spatula]
MTLCPPPPCYCVAHIPLQLINKKKYGTLWLSEIRGLKVVNVADPDLIEQVLRNEGRFPSRGDIKEWKEHRALRGLEFGPILKGGLQIEVLVSWQKTFRMLKATVFVDLNFSYGNQQRLFHDLLHSPTTLSNIGLWGSRSLSWQTMGARQDTAFTGHQSYHRAHTDTNTHALTPGPFSSQKPDNTTKRNVDQRLADLQTQLERGDPVEGDYLTYLLKSQQLTQSEIYSSVTDLLLAGVDTTSNTLTWALYHLARDQELQNSVYREVSGVVPGDHIPNAVDLEKMPLVKAVIKEVLRLYPVVPANSRTLQTDLVLGEYYIPSKVFIILCHYAASREESQFPDPLAFKPERWIKKEQGKKPHPFSSVPFGYGVRGCLGRRIAELEMYLALSRLVKNFEIQTNPKSKPVFPKTRTFIVPGAPVNLEFHNRSSGV